MKKQNTNIRFVLLTAIIFTVVFLPGSFAAMGKKLNAYMSYATFNSPENGPYIETYLTVEGASVNYTKIADGKYQATIQVIMLFRKGEEIANYDKYDLNSPEVEDTVNINFSFIDQQRYSLPNGAFEFEIQIWDKNSDAKPFVYLQPLTIEYLPDRISVSEIELLSSYSKTENPGILSKNGYDLIPYIFNYYPEKISKLTFYSEIYNTNIVLGANEKYLISYYLELSGQNKPLDKFISQKKETTAPVNVIFSEFDISELPSGNYNLVIEARDKSNKLVGLNKIFIMRNNPSIQIKIDEINQVDISNTFSNEVDNIDSLRVFIKYLTPIATEQEIAFINAHLTTSDLGTLQKFFYRFWYERNELEPEREWLNYHGEVNKVNAAYTTSIMQGYESDRGHTYLKYGPPNAISESYNEPSTYPYEIWHYYVIKGGQRNRKFVFYTKDMVTNDFTLLHSDVNGEISNYRWQYVLYSRVDDGFNIEKGVVEDSWGGDSKKYFDLPR